MDGVYTLHSLQPYARQQKPPANSTNSNEWMELAQAYVRPQPLTPIFPLEEGLQKGTIFPNLYKPYVKRGGD